MYKGQTLKLDSFTQPLEVVIKNATAKFVDDIKSIDRGDDEFEEEKRNAKKVLKAVLR